MITSLVMMSVFKENSINQGVEDNSTLISLARCGFDLGFEVGEIIKINNIVYLENGYTFDVRVRSKVKVLTQEKIQSYDSEIFSLRIEYIVEIVNPEDLEIIRTRLRRR